MSDQVRYAAFADELVKIAVVRGVARHMGNWMRKGWDDAGGWMTDKKWLLGKARLPLGGKSLWVGTTALAAPGAMSKQDPYGANRSRAERTTGLAGSVAGGLAGSGALMGGPNARLKLLRTIAGGIGGSILGERLATKPFRSARMRAQQPVIADPNQRAALLQQAQGY